MTVQYENHCVDCPPEIGCLGRHCHLKNTPIYYCDICSEQIDAPKNGEDICEKCWEEKNES